jgi:branched-chain amino acid transport system ATP-binding protein
MFPILKTISLYKKFDNVVAAENINVEIYPGELIGIIGANGAGKTTFVNMITGYLEPTEGKILYNNENITGLAPRIITRKGIHRSFQISQLFEELTVIENVIAAETLRRSKIISCLAEFKTPEKIKKGYELLKQFNLIEYADEIVNTLPQGVKKLLDIAMAVLGSPKLLLLDEPTSGVAINEKFKLMDIVMNGVKSIGAAIIFIEHDMEIIEKYAEKVVAFYDGKIIAEGKTEDVLNNSDVKKYVIGYENV